ncbi:MAG: fluoride efflux transporter CrcB [Bacteroidota bacterium]|nr:fluoride efflux transporter CrcB [Bacteroidota bacterium]
MKIILFIGLGSFIGGVCRHLVNQFFLLKVNPDFPYSTLLVNLMGSFVIGLVYGMQLKFNHSLEWHLFLTTGFLGGFTTFSAFSYESMMMLRNGSNPQAILYILGSVFIGILLCFAGIQFTKVL